MILLHRGVVDMAIYELLLNPVCRDAIYLLQMFVVLCFANLVDLLPEIDLRS